MSNLDMISMALKNLWKRKLRTFLTVLGVIIGTASIVVMVSIGIGMNESYIEQIQQMGSLQVITVSSPNGDGGMGMRYSNSTQVAKSDKSVVLNTQAIEDFKKISGVETATPLLETYMRVVSGKYVNDVNLRGIYPESMDLLGYKTSEGRLLNIEDKKGAVFGSYVLQEFYNPKLNWNMRWNSPSPEIKIFEDKLYLTFDQGYGTSNADKKIKPLKIEAVGVFAGEGETSYSVYMPLDFVQSVIDKQTKYENSVRSGSSNSGSNKQKKGEYSQALVKVNSIDQVKVVMQQIKDMGYEAYSLTEYLESMQETSKMMQMVLGAIGAVSLFVAAIGITNTMIMSIYERTREIGVMKVIGASLFDIQRLFLTEAAFIGFSGGTFGILISLAISSIINIFAQGDFKSSVPIWLCLAGLAFSTFVGIAAGYFPARRAMKLSALSAIKTE